MAAPADALAPAAANSEDPGTAQTNGKRKRSPEESATEDSLVNGTPLQEHDAPSLNSFHDLLLDIVEAMRPYDTTPSILDCEITSATTDTHTPKRAKLSTNGSTPTVASLVQSHAYKDLDTFYQDVKNTISLSLARTELPYQRTSILAFEAEFEQTIAFEVQDAQKSLPRSQENQVVLPSLSSSKPDPLHSDPKLVLSTWGAPGASYVGNRLYSTYRLSSAEQQSSALSSLPLNTLPRGIDVSSVRPQDPDSQLPEKPPTFKDLFTPRCAKTLEPPRFSSHAANRGQSITWVHQEPSSQRPRTKDRTSYYDQPISSGQWLTYNAGPSTSQPTLSEEKRKQRDRALSTGEANAELTEEEQEAIRLAKEAHQQAKDDALFRSAYSSFAPTHDNAGAVVPERLRSRLWWHRHLESNLLRFGSLDEIEGPGVLDGDSTAAVNGDQDEDQKFREMLDSWVDEPVNNPLSESFDEEKEKEAAELLSDVSDLLETLASFQRNRSLSLGTKQQGSSTQNKSLVELLGDPSTPSGSESILYETLKSQLTMIVSMLPPFAVAKLDGDKLNSLNISTKVKVQTPIRKGTLLGPEASRPPHHAYNAMGNATPAMRPQAGVTSRTPSQQQVPPLNYRGNYTPGRAPSSTSYSNYRPTPGVPNHTPGYTSQSQLQQQAAQRLSYSQYGQQPTPSSTTPLMNGARPLPNGYGGYGQRTAASGSPIPVQPGQFQRPSQPNYQQRAQNAQNAQNAQQQTYSTYSYSAGRSASPQNAASYMANQAQRANYATPGQASGRGWFSNGTIGSMVFSPEEARQLEDRQKAQMAAQHAQLRQNSNTPQPMYAPGTQANGTPALQQNGVSSQSLN